MGRNPLKSGQAFKDKRKRYAENPEKEVAIPSNRVKRSKTLLRMAEEWGEISVAIPSNRVKRSKDKRSGNGSCVGTCRNPLKSGQAFKDDARAPARGPLVGRNPLKSGQAFKADPTNPT